MGHGAGIREVAWLDCAGSGQVVVEGDYAYLGHMDPPHGTSVVDVSDPRHPRIVGRPTFQRGCTPTRCASATT